MVKKLEGAAGAGLISKDINCEAPKMGELVNHTLLDVQQLAEWLGLKPSWVYDHADELGAYRLGKYLRFELSRVLERLQQGAIAPSIVKPPTQRPCPTPIKKATSDERGTN